MSVISGLNLFLRKDVFSGTILSTGWVAFAYVESNLLTQFGPSFTDQNLGIVPLADKRNITATLIRTTTNLQCSIFNSTVIIFSISFNVPYFVLLLLW